MAKKRTAKKRATKKSAPKKPLKQKPVKKQAATKKRAAKKQGVKKKAKVAHKTLGKKRATAKPAAKKKTATKKPTRSQKQGLIGRPRVAGTAELDQLFLKDYEARQVFAFLGVKTLKELEAHAPQEIIDHLTAPLVQTVNRIRKALAISNRYLNGDESFVVEFRKSIE